jgi:hypothetical protein
VQNALKHLLRFGTVTRYLGYSALKARDKIVLWLSGKGPV